MIEMILLLLIAYGITFAATMYFHAHELPFKHSPFFLSLLMLVFSYAGWVTIAEHPYGTSWFQFGLVILISGLLTSIVSFLYWVRGMTVGYP